MARYRPSRFLRWIRAGLAVAAYLVVVAGVAELDIDAGVAPPWAVLAVPPFVYVVFSILFVRRSSVAQRLVWTGAACIVHLLLGTCAALMFLTTASLAPLPALALAFTHLAPTPALTLLATPFVLAPLRRRVLPSRAPSRVDRATRVPVPALAPVSTATPFAREARQRDGATAPAPPVAAPAPEPPRAPAHPAPADDRVIRVSFDRVASQLPAEAFVLPFERLAESLREPHVLLIPRRMVMQQLPNGAVEIEWPVVAAQFPALGLGMSEVEFRKQYPDLKLSLPVEELLRQLPDDILDVPDAPRIAGLEKFPAPFEPYAADDPRVVARAATEAAAPPAPLEPPIPSVETAAVPSVERPATPSGSERPSTPFVKPAAAAPSVSAPPAPPSAPPPSPRVPTATPIAESSSPQIAAPTPVAAEPPAPRVAVTPARIAPVAPPPPPRERVDRDTLARLAAAFANVGTFDVWCGAVDDVPLIAFVGPNVARDAVTALAARLAGLLGDAAGEQVTVRTARAGVVVTAAPTPLVVAVRRPGAPLALLELRAARAAALAGPTVSVGAAPSRTLSAVAVEPRVAGVASALPSFGGVEASVLDEPRGARVYVFREPGREAERVAALALAAWEGCRRAGNAELGTLVSIVFRQGRRRMLVRPVGGGDALLAAAGPVTRPGRAWREADRAAVALEAH
jgi:hypothetical protein